MKRILILFSMLLIIHPAFCDEDDDLSYNGSTHCNPKPCGRGYNPYPTPCCPPTPCDGSPGVPCSPCPPQTPCSPPCASTCYPSNSCQTAPCSEKRCCNPNCTCPPGTCRPGSCPCYPSAPARGVDCSLNVISMGVAFLLVAGVAAIILSSSSSTAHVHD